MREHARSQIDQGDGVATLYMRLEQDRNQYFLGTELMKEKINMKNERPQATFVALPDAFQYMESAGRKLSQASPHNNDNSIIALSAHVLEAITISLVRTTSPQRDLVTPSPKNIASLETTEGKKAADLASKIATAQAAGRLTGEDYVRWRSSSPNGDVTKGILKLALGGGAKIQSTQGDYSRQLTSPIRHEVQCSQTQRIQIIVLSAPPDSHRIAAKVVGYGSHADFWHLFEDRKISIDAIDPATKQGLLLAKILEESIDVEVSISINMLRGRRGGDACNASIIQMPNTKELALKVIKRLDEQLSLDLQFPE